MKFTLKRNESLLKEALKKEIDVFEAKKGTTKTKQTPKKKSVISYEKRLEMIEGKIKKVNDLANELSIKTNKWS